MKVIFSPFVFWHQFFSPRPNHQNHLNFLLKPDDEASESWPHFRKRGSILYSNSRSKQIWEGQHKATLVSLSDVRWDLFPHFWKQSSPLYVCIFCLYSASSEHCLICFDYMQFRCISSLLSICLIKTSNLFCPLSLSVSLCCIVS